MRSTGQRESPSMNGDGKSHAPLDNCKRRDQLPPHNRDAERSLLSSMLRDNSSIDDATVRAHDFYVVGHQLIFSAIAKLYAEETAADIVTVAEWLMQRKLIDDAGGPSYLAELWDAAPSAANVRKYAEIVRENATRRRLLYAADEFTRHAFDLGRPAADVLADAELTLREIADTGSTAGYRFAPMSTRDFMRADFRPEWGIKNVFFSFSVSPWSSAAQKRA